MRARHFLILTNHLPKKTSIKTATSNFPCKQVRLHLQAIKLAIARKNYFKMLENFDKTESKDMMSNIINQVKFTFRGGGGSFAYFPCF